MLIKLNFVLTLFIALTLMVSFVLPGCHTDTEHNLIEESDKQESFQESNKSNVSLPSIDELEEQELDLTVVEAIDNRRSVRQYSEEVIKLEELSGLLWAAQGITDEDRGYRAAPSAGATYPMEVYVLAGEVDELPAGIYRYTPGDHQLTAVREGDYRNELMASALNQEPIGDAPLNLLVTSVYERVTGTYGERGKDYAKMEAGHISQNIYLKSEALNLGTVAIGAFDEEEVSSILNLDDGEEPMYIMPVGNE